MEILFYLFAFPAIYINLGEAATFAHRSVLMAHLFRYISCI